LHPDLRTRLLDQGGDLIHASGLLRRHRQLYIGQEMVAAILALAESSREDASAIFADKRERWERQGGFIESLSLEDIHGWIESDRHIVAEASSPQSNRFHPVAQAVFTLPAAGWVVPQLTDARDEVLDPAIHRRILQDGPRATALVDFLGVLPEWSHSRLAGSARHAGILELIRRNRSLPPKAQIRQVLGMAFAVQKLEIVNPEPKQRFGRFIELSEIGQDEIVNRASLDAIGKSVRSPAHLLGMWRSAPPVTVVLDACTFRLHVHWYCFVRLLEEVSANLDPHHGD
jgi:hypothetical protein